MASEMASVHSVTIEAVEAKVANQLKVGGPLRASSTVIVSLKNYIVEFVKDVLVGLRLRDTLMRASYLLISGQPVVRSRKACHHSNCDTHDEWYGRLAKNRACPASPALDLSRRNFLA